MIARKVSTRARDLPSALPAGSHRVRSFESNRLDRPDAGEPVGFLLVKVSWHGALFKPGDWRMGLYVQYPVSRIQYTEISQDQYPLSCVGMMRREHLFS